MAKRIVLFSDGTGNSSASVFKTNVWRIYDALDLSSGADQLTFYDDGVGASSNKFIAGITGAVGIGLKRNVLDIYKFLSRQYGDALKELRAKHGAAIPAGELPKISCFGFSRGAFTMRVLVGLIQSQGLLTKAGDAELDWFARRAYAAFREQAFHTKTHVEDPFRYLWNKVAPMIDKRTGDGNVYDTAKNFPAKGWDGLAPGAPAVSIEFLGLWDTVGAYGMPLEEFRIAIDKLIFPLTFTDYRLCPMVERVRQALSVDDERDAFTPIPFHDSPQRAEEREARQKLMDAGRTEDAAFAQTPQRSVQLWFSGVHANVGGGNPDDSMAYEPLRWILREAIESGAVVCRQDAVEDINRKATAFGKLYDSRAGFGGLYRYKPRDIAFVMKPPAETRDKIREENPNLAITDEDRLPLVHDSVVFRIAGAYDGYAPIALPPVFGVADGAGRLRHVVDFAQSPEERATAITSASPLDLAVKKLRPPKPDQKALVDSAVFWRRATYQATIWPLILLAFFPLLDRRDIDENSLPGTIFRLIGGFLPGWAEPWITAFRAYPVWAITLLAISAVSFWWGGKLKTLIGDRSRAAWAILPIDPPQTRLGKLIFDPLAIWILGSKALNNLWDGLVMGAIPVYIALMVVFFVAPSVADRLVFQAQSFFGGVCKSDPRKPPVRLSGPASFTFETTNPCAASGVWLERGQFYRVTVIIEDDWRDYVHDADLAGLDWDKLDLRDKALYISVTLPWRRVLGEPWFKPMLRIGEKGLTEFPAEPDAPFRKDEPRRALAMTFKAPADGELFAFVNDAYSGVLPLAWIEPGKQPGAGGHVRHTYENNHGSAKIAIGFANESEILAAKGLSKK